MKLYICRNARGKIVPLTTFKGAQFDKYFEILYSANKVRIPFTFWDEIEGKNLPNPLLSKPYGNVKGVIVDNPERRTLFQLLEEFNRNLPANYFNFSPGLRDLHRANHNIRIMHKYQGGGSVYWGSHDTIKVFFFRFILF